MNKEREIERININLTEARKMIKIHLDKFGKDIASDYRIVVPADISEASKEEFHTWIMSVKDSIIKVEEKLEVKSILYVMLNSYLNSLQQLKKVDAENELSK